MLITKLVLRVLEEDGRLLGWTDVQAVARGDGCLWIVSPTPILIDQAGTPAICSVHWCDVNIEVRLGLVLDPVRVGDTITVAWPEPAIRCGPAASGLAPVTVGRALVAVPVGALGARTQ